MVMKVIILLLVYGDESDFFVFVYGDESDHFVVSL